MASSASNRFTWKPEDDVLLKNSMQEGASFEVLAKGVVPFSRRFTVQELRDRWHSLLYDPDVAAQASVSMFQVELSGFNPVLKIEPSRSFNFKETLGKRKSGSIRQKYRTMRKKFRKDFFSPPDFNLLEEESSVHNSKEKESHGEKCMIRNGIIQDHFELKQEADDYYITECSNKAEETSTNKKLIRKDGFLDDVSTSLSNDVRIFSRKPSGVSRFMKGTSVEFNEDCSNGFLQGDPLNSPNGNSFTVLGFPSPQSTLPLWEPINGLSVDASTRSRDCTVKDSSLYDVVPTGDGPGLVSNSSVVAAEVEDISDSLLNLSNEDDLLLLDVDNNKELSQKSCKLESQITGPETSPKDHTTATSKGSSRSVPKVDYGEICCVLNTEDPEIPCNDDIFLLIHHSTSFAFSADPPQPISRDVADVSSTIKQNVKAIKMVPKGKGIAKESPWLQKVVPSVIPEVHSVKPVCPETRALALPSLPVDAKSQSLLTNPSIISTSRLMNEDLPKIKSKDVDTLAAFSEPQNAVKIPFPDPIIIPSTSTSDHEESESDDDVPSYSDIEALIHEMDLVPFDLDITNTKQVSPYQHESSIRTMMRLEQCAESHLQRRMTREGAFAVFYGRHLKHYIKKTEVLLGRSTDDFDVDIDLSAEGRANKISRRQAIIKVEKGSFFLKNLGKSVISVNGKCIPTGQQLSLSSSCLIEIRGMSFIFEINHKCVSQDTMSPFSKKQRTA